MGFDFNYQGVFLFFFFVQGLVFSFLLLRKGIQYGSQASKWLSLFIFLCCLYITPWMCGHAGWYGIDGFREFLFFVPFQQLFFLGPIIYFYTRSLLDPSFRLSRLALVHFLPGTIYLLYSIGIFVADQFIFEDYYFYADGRDKDLDKWYQISGLASMIIYASLSIRLYYDYRKRIYQVLSYADTVLFAWVNKYLLAFLIILVLRILFLILYPNWGSFGMKWWYYILFACLYYYIALEGYTNSIASSISFRASVYEKDQLINGGTISQIDIKEEEEEITLDLEVWKDKTKVLMEEEQLFQLPSLTLGDVASKLGVTTKQTSNIINQGFQMNFNDFINQYRVEAIKVKLQEGEHQYYTLLSIALASGFNSKTTFNRVFKKNTGLSPRQYLDQMKQQ